MPVEDAGSTKKKQSPVQLQNHSANRRIRGSFRSSAPSPESTHVVDTPPVSSVDFPISSDFPLSSTASKSNGPDTNGVGGDSTQRMSQDGFLDFGKGNGNGESTGVDEENVSDFAFSDVTSPSASSSIPTSSHHPFPTFPTSTPTNHTSGNAGGGVGGIPSRPLSAKSASRKIQLRRAPPSLDANDKDVDLQVAPSDEVESPAVNHNHGAKQSVEEVAQWDSQPKTSQPLQPVTTSESTTVSSTAAQPNRHEIANKFGGAINRRMPNANEPSSKQPSPMDTTTATISSSSSIKPSIITHIPSANFLIWTAMARIRV